MHGLVAARLGDAEMALRFFRQTAAIDLADTHVATDGGVHIAALGGIWTGAGIRSLPDCPCTYDGIAVEPRLPSSLAPPSLPGPAARNRRLKISIDPDAQIVEATLEAGEPMTLVMGGRAKPALLRGRSRGRNEKSPRAGLNRQLLPPHFVG